MNENLWRSAACVAAALLTIVAAPHDAGAQDLKIGVVIPQRLLARSEVGQQAAEKLKARKEKAQERLDEATEELKDMQEDVMKRAMMLSAEEKQKAGEELEKKQREVARMKEDLERELQKAEQEVLGEVNEFLTGAMTEFGETNQYDLIMDGSAAVFFSEKPDVTDEVVEFVNEKYKKK